MPFKSDKQRKWMHANEPEMADKWEKEEAIKGKLQNLIKQELKINKLEAFRPKGISQWKSFVLLPKSKMYFDPTTQYFWLMGPGGEPDWEDDPIEPKDWDYKRTLSRLSSKDKSIIKKSLRGKGNWKEATTSVSIPGYLTPQAFKKSTQKAIDVDDEDDEKNESINEASNSVPRHILKQLGSELNKATDMIVKVTNKYKNEGDIGGMVKIWMRGLHLRLKKDGIKIESVNEARTINVEPNWEGMWRFFKRMAITNPRDWKKMERTLGSDWLKIDKMAQQKGWKSESVNESDLGLTYKKGKTVKVTHKKSGKELVIIDKPNVKREYEKIGYFAEGTVNELQMAPFSSQEAKHHINSDIKDMSKLLGKTSQQVIKIMMDGVRKGKYTAMDISRGVQEGPAQRTHFGEMTFIKSLWTKMREKFRRYSKDRKLS